MRRKKSTGYLRFFFLRVVDVRRPADDAPRDGAPSAVARAGDAGLARQAVARQDDRVAPRAGASQAIGLAKAIGHSVGT